jgi:drug/metabolite transporter (DMT)-like permease
MEHLWAKYTLMHKNWTSWLVFALLAIIWGSSFILMKEGLNAFNPYQVASLRMLTAGIVLLPFAYKAIKSVPNNKMVLVILSGILGNFIPAYLFCIAETQIDSSLAGILNSLTPMFTIIVGVLFFKVQTSMIKVLGMIIGFIGLSILLASGKDVSFQNLSFASLVLLATLLYGINVNILSRYMQQLGSLNVASIAFVFLMIPSICVLYFTGYFNKDFSDPIVLRALAATSVLGIVGTSIATILFYYLVKQSGMLFGSMVTYGIPVVAVAWGVWDGESLNLTQIGCLGLILFVVYIVNRGHLKFIKKPTT